MLKLANLDIKDVKIGSTNISKVYLGTQLIWKRVVLTDGVWNQVSNPTASGSGITVQTTFVAYRATKIYGRIEGNSYGDNSVFKMEVQENGSWITIDSHVQNISAYYELTVTIDKIITGLRISWNGGAYVARYCTIATTQRYV